MNATLNASETATGSVYEKKCSRKFCKIHRKTPVPESLSKQIYNIKQQNKKLLSLYLIICLLSYFPIL